MLIYLHTLHAESLPTVPSDTSCMSDNPLWPKIRFSLLHHNYLPAFSLLFLMRQPLSVASSLRISKTCCLTRRWSRDLYRPFPSSVWLRVCSWPGDAPISLEWHSLCNGQSHATLLLHLLAPGRCQDGYCPGTVNAQLVALSNNWACCLLAMRYIRL